jgi:hypothetical protein
MTTMQCVDVNKQGIKMIATTFTTHNSKTFKAGSIPAWSSIMNYSYDRGQEGSPRSGSEMLE